MLKIDKNQLFHPKAILKRLVQVFGESSDFVGLTESELFNYNSN